MKTHTSILTLFFLLTAYFVHGQSNKISHSLTFDYIEDCETGMKECVPLNINRKTINDSILIYFQNGGTISDVYLYSDSIFNKWINKTIVNPEFLKHDKKYANEGMLIMDLTGLSDGRYRAHMLASGRGGIIEINLKTLSSNCSSGIDTIDGMGVYRVVEKMPKYKNGNGDLLRYINENLIISLTQNIDDLQNDIYITFVIDTVGNIRNSCIMSPKYTDKLTPVELEILKIIDNMTTWNVGIHNGKVVPVRFFLPIHFDYRK